MKNFLVLFIILITNSANAQKYSKAWVYDEEGNLRLLKTEIDSSYIHIWEHTLDNKESILLSIEKSSLSKSHKKVIENNIIISIWYKNQITLAICIEDKDFFLFSPINISKKYWVTRQIWFYEKKEELKKILKLPCYQKLQKYPLIHSNI